MKIAVAPSAGGTYSNAVDGLGQYGTAGADVTFTIAASKYIVIPPFITAGASDAKLIFGSSETSKTYEYVTREIA